MTKNTATVNTLDIKIQTKELVHALNFASSIVEKRNVSSELNNIKLVAKDGILEIGATDMDLYLNQTIGAEIISEGETTVSTQTLSEIVRKIPDGEIVIRQNAFLDQLELIAKSCTFDLLTLPIIQFPMMEIVDSDINFTIPCTDLARILEYTHLAMSNDETRYNLNGVYLHVKNKELCSAATDGHRLFIASCILPKTNLEFGAILPKKTVSELIKIIKDTKNINSEITVALGTNRVMFTCNNLTLVSKIIDGVFPEYESFIPQDNKSKLTVNTKLLNNAIDRVAAVTIDKFRIIKFNISSEYLNITAHGEAKGSAKENILFSQKKDEFCHFDGKDMSIGFNPKYLQDVLSNCKEHSVDLYLHDEFSPILIKSQENPGDHFVIMPVKV